MKFRILALVPALFALDRASKIWAHNDLRLRPGGVMELIPRVFRLRYVENDGAAFSLFSGNPWLLIGMTSMIMLAVLCYMLFSKKASRFALCSLALVLAGGLGNLYDRIAYQKVIDYAELLFIRFAIFNLADVFVCGGAILGAIALFLMDRKEVKRVEMDGGGG